MVNNERTFRLYIESSSAYVRTKLKIRHASIQGDAKLSHTHKPWCWFEKEKYSVILNLYNTTLNGGGTWSHRWTQIRREVCTNL